MPEANLMYTLATVNAGSVIPIRSVTRAWVRESTSDPRRLAVFEHDGTQRKSDEKQAAWTAMCIALR
jgi:hypothetical protein